VARLDAAGPCAEPPGATPTGSGAVRHLESDRSGAARIGFARVEQVVPVLGADLAPQAPAPFRALLSAGAARADKGFTHIVDLVEHMAASGSALPIVVQASGDHYGRHDESTRADLLRLRGCRYPYLTVRADTLDATQYQQLFAGAICLQPYCRSDYADKMSAVTFDALRNGAPIVTVAGTTMAAIVESSGAGVVVDQPTPQALLEACSRIAQQFPQYCERARRAAELHSAGSAWRPMVEQLQLACAGSERSPPVSPASPIGDPR
jgi:hypothetical protein